MTHSRVTAILIPHLLKPGPRDDVTGGKLFTGLDQLLSLSSSSVAPVLIQGNGQMVTLSLVLSRQYKW
jgi:hypothetical protein